MPNKIDQKLQETLKGSNSEKSVDLSLSLARSKLQERIKFVAIWQEEVGSVGFDYF